MGKYVVIEFNRSALVDECIFFSSEENAAKYTLFHQLNQVNFSDLDKNDYKELIYLILQQKYIEAYNWFQENDYWKLVWEGRSIYYYKLKEEELTDNLKFPTSIDDL